jgi:hypothetical protein
VTAVTGTHSLLQAVNSIIQGTAADIVKLAMVKTSELLTMSPQWKSTSLLMQIHDELVFEAPQDLAHDTAQHIATVMETVVDLDVKLPVVMYLFVLSLTLLQKNWQALGLSKNFRKNSRKAEREPFRAF